MSAYEQLLHPTARGWAQTRSSAWHLLLWLVARFRLVSKLWSCWHRRMSRPFTRDGRTYRVCLRCGVQRHFDLEQWTTTGSYYRDKTVVTPVGTEGVAIRRHRKLRLIA
jgi:hypothetical protein